MALHRPTHRGCRGGVHILRRIPVKQTGDNTANLLNIQQDTNVRPAKLCLLNARSVFNKADFLVDYVADHDLDILCITESWPSSEDTVVVSAVTPCGRQALRPSSLAAVKPCGRQALRPSSLAAVKPCGRHALRPSSLAAVNPCGRQALRPSILAAVKPCGRQALRPSSLAAVGVSIYNYVAAESPLHYTSSPSTDRRRAAPTHSRSPSTDRRRAAPTHSRLPSTDRRRAAPTHSRSPSTDRRRAAPTHSRSPSSSPNFEISLNASV